METLTESFPFRNMETVKAKCKMDTQ